MILDSQLHNDMEGIMHDVSKEVEENYPDGSFRQLYILGPTDTGPKINKCQICWHPALIKWCLPIKYKSSSGYHDIRTTGVLTLLSERTLNDYTHVVKRGLVFRNL